MKTLAILSALALTGCVTTVLPDGTVQTAPDYNAWLEVARMVREDQTPPVTFDPTPDTLSK